MDRGRLPSLSLAALAIGVAIISAQGVRAADLDDAYQAPRQAPRPHAATGAPGVLLDPRCRIIPQPEHNLYDQTARFRPTVVCMSRGMLADSFGPFPPYYPY